jgi:hypothetical protein
MFIHLISNTFGSLSRRLWRLSSQPNGSKARRTSSYAQSHNLIVTGSSMKLIESFRPPSLAFVALIAACSEGSCGDGKLLNCLHMKTVSCGRSKFVNSTMGRLRTMMDASRVRRIAAEESRRQSSQSWTVTPPLHLRARRRTKFQGRWHTQLAEGAARGEWYTFPGSFSSCSAHVVQQRPGPRRLSASRVESRAGTARQASRRDFCCQTYR